MFTPVTSMPFCRDSGTPMATPSSISDSSTPGEGAPCSPANIFSPNEEPSREASDDYFGLGTCIVNVDDALYQDPELLMSVAKKLSLINSHSFSFRAVSVLTIMGYLKAVRFPFNTVALAYNILANYQCDEFLVKRHDSAGSLDLADRTARASDKPSSELIILAALRIAMAYLEDQKHPTSWWVSTVADSSFSTLELRSMTRSIFESVGWKLSLFAAPDAIRSAQASLATVTPAATRPHKTRLSLNLKTPPVETLRMQRKMSLKDLVTPFTTLFIEQSGIEELARETNKTT